MILHLSVWLNKTIIYIGYSLDIYNYPANSPPSCSTSQTSSSFGMTCSTDIYEMENKQCLKPPTSVYIYICNSMRTMIMKILNEDMKDIAITIKHNSSKSSKRNSHISTWKSRKCKHQSYGNVVYISTISIYIYACVFK